jgi:hypothetical protein
LQQRFPSRHRQAYNQATAGVDVLTSAIRVACTKPELRGQIMMMRVTGTVVDGSLMLDQRLNLPDQSRVNVTLEPLDAEASARRSDL